MIERLYTLLHTLYIQLLFLIYKQANALNIAVSSRLVVVWALFGLVHTTYYLVRLTRTTNQQPNPCPYRLANT